MSAPGPNQHLHTSPGFQPLVQRLGLSAERVFTDPRIVPWRSLDDRENCTLDAPGPDGSPVRLHVKRYRAARGTSTPADEEVRGHHALAEARIPTAPLVAWGNLADGRSFTIWQDLAGYTPGDKLVEAGLPFDALLAPTADLAARLHAAGMHHRDLYLCHFMAKADSGGGPPDVRLIDVARVDRMRSVFTRRRWVVKDLAQFWYSTTKLPVTDAQRTAWLERYASARGDGTTAAGLRPAIDRKVRRIARHDRELNAAQPTRNISIPSSPSPSSPATDAPAFFVRPATVDDAPQLIAHMHRLCAEPGVQILTAPGEFTLTAEQERKFIADTQASENSAFLVAEAGGEIIGMLNCKGGVPQRERHVTRLGLSVRREWRGRGVGTALMRAAIAWARRTGTVTRIELQVYASNDRAARLYERLGFQTEGRIRRAVLHNGKYEDNLLMALLL